VFCKFRPFVLLFLLVCHAKLEVVAGPMDPHFVGNANKTEIIMLVFSSKKSQRVTHGKASLLQAMSTMDLADIGLKPADVEHLLTKMKR
jgi:uncharacterized protein YjiS (DUF1127 family)